MTPLLVMPDWPHAPVHRLSASGAYMVTAGTYRKAPFFQTEDRLSFVEQNLFGLCSEYAFDLQAWAIFPNHYHFIFVSRGFAERLPQMISHLHTATATAVNRAEGTPGRKVWFQYWDKRLTFERSYYARLNYVHQNAVHHRVARLAANYPWCSAGWFERCSAPSFRKRIFAMKYDKIAVPDGFGNIARHFQSVVEKRRQAAALQKGDAQDGKE